MRLVNGKTVKVGMVVLWSGNYYKVAHVDSVQVILTLLGHEHHTWNHYQAHSNYNGGFDYIVSQPTVQHLRSDRFEAFQEVPTT